MPGNKSELRKVWKQAPKSFAVVIPPRILRALEIEAGDYLRITTKDGKIVMERV